jgi:pimeloyl-ACP methyl ester carboxylesterase
VDWYWIALAVIVGMAVGLGLFHLYILRRYMSVVTRIFQEKPLFILPFGQPVEGAEEVTLTTPDGVALQGCYLRTSEPRKAVILFGLEYGSNRWACVPYCDFLREQGYDIFTFETRGQGKSPAQPGYEPLQWVTDYELIDFRTALAYLKSRPDRDPRGVGLFGLSKGGSAGLMVAARDEFVRCCVTDGAFGTLTTVMPYVKQWMFIYLRYRWVGNCLPNWYLRLLAKKAIRITEAERRCNYPTLERALPKLAPRPLFMIHGGADNYIKPEMARELYERAREPREFWLVEGAKHNQAITVANGEYQRRVLEFFDTHLTSTARGSS